jgi:hypothetical protein
MVKLALRLSVKDFPRSLPCSSLTRLSRSLRASAPTERDRKGVMAMNTNAIFNRRVYQQARQRLSEVLSTLQSLSPTGEVIDVEIDRVKRLIELALREPKVPVEDAPICKMHNLQMNRREGQFGAFWSCPAKDNGVWCSYRPSTR